MGRPAARLGDMHVCPAVSGNIPHVGGPIIDGCASVLVGKRPSARITDKAVCVGPIDRIVMGSKSVMICGNLAARLGDRCAHGGRVVVGTPTVLIG